MKHVVEHGSSMWALRFQFQVENSKKKTDWGLIWWFCEMRVRMGSQPNVCWLKWYTPQLFVPQVVAAAVFVFGILCKTFGPITKRGRLHSWGWCAFGVNKNSRNALQIEVAPQRLLTQISGLHALHYRDVEQNFRPSTKKWVHTRALGEIRFQNKSHYLN
jgi:hypothetical protein